MHALKIKLVRFLRTDMGVGLVGAAGWQFVMTSFGLLIDKTLTIFKHHPSSASLLSHMAHWDAGWYLNIIHGAYITNPAAPVFYPLFPYTVKLLDILTFHKVGILVIGLVVNTLATWAIIVALLKIASFFQIPAKRAWLPLLFLAAPTAFFLNVFYGEALFCALAFWAYYFALSKRWNLMCILLAFAMTSRLPAILFILLCALEYLKAYDWNIKKALNRQAAWFLVVPTGFIAYSLYLRIIMGDFLAMFHGYHATKDWVYQVFNLNIFSTLKDALQANGHYLKGTEPFGQIQFVNVTLPLIGLGVLFLAACYLLKRLGKDGIPLAVFSFATIIFLTLNSNLVSIDRYLLPCLSIYIALLLLVNRLRGQIFAHLFMHLGILLQAYLYISFVCGYFAG